MKHARDDYNRIQDPAGLIPVEEPVFLLRGQDKYAAETLRYYAALVAEGASSAEEYEKVKPIVNATMGHAKLMDKWPKKKFPDMPINTLTEKGREVDPTVNVYRLNGVKPVQMRGCSVLLENLALFVFEQAISLRENPTYEQRITVTESGIDYCRNLMASRQISDYQVVCNDTNNSETSLGYDIYVKIGSIQHVIQYQETVLCPYHVNEK